MANEYGSNFRILIAQAESTPGTIIDLSAVDPTIRVRGNQDDIVVTPNQPFDNENSKHATGDHGKDASIQLESTATIDFMVRWSASDDYGTDPSTEPTHYLFPKSCGLAAVDFTTAGVGLMDKKEQDDTTLSIWVIDIQRGLSAPAGIATKFKGCIGNMQLGAENTAAPIMANYSFQGVMTDVIDIANGSLPDYVGADIEAALAERWVNYTASVHGTNRNIASWQLDTGNDIQMLRNQGEDAGVSHFAIVDKNPRLSINPTKLAVATSDDFNIVTTNSIGTINFISGGGSDTRKFSFYFPRTQLISNAEANREGVRAYDQTYKLLRNEQPGGSATNSDMADESAFMILQGATS